MQIIILVLFIFAAVFGYAQLSGRIRRLEEQLGVRPETPTHASEPVVHEAPVHAAVSHVAHTPKRRSQDFEFKLGSRFFTAVGGIALLFGIGFFLRYAFENNLITAPMRVALGVVVGAVCLGLGEWLRRKYAQYGQALMGVGLGIFYLTLYAASQLYHLFQLPASFVGMCAVTALGLVLALRLNSEPLAIFSLIGGLLTPFLLGSGENKPHVLFPYLAILDVAVLAFSIKKLWRGVTITGMLGTAVAWCAWYGSFYTTAQWQIAEAYATVFFLIFLAVSLIQYFVVKAEQKEGDLAVTALNPMLYAIGTFGALWHVSEEWTGMWFAVVGVLYVGLTFLVSGKDDRSRRYREYLAVIGAAMLAIAVPVYFHGYGKPIGWAALAAAFTVWSYVLGSRPLRILAQAVGFIVSLSLLTNYPTAMATDVPWLNPRFFTYCFVILALVGTSVMHWLRGSAADPSWKTLDGIKAYALLCLALGTEISAHYHDTWVVVAMALTALVGAVASFITRQNALRVFVYITYLVTTLWMFLILTSNRASDYPVFNRRVFACLVLIASAAIVSKLMRSVYREALVAGERRLAAPVLFVSIHLAGLWLVSTEIISYFNLRLTGDLTTEARAGLRYAKNSALSVAWTVYALALLAWGILKKSVVARGSSLTLFVIVVLKVFLYDTSELSNFYRFISFITLGVLLLLSGYLYNRFRERIRQFVSAK